MEVFAPLHLAAPGASVNLTNQPPARPARAAGSSATPSTIRPGRRWCSRRSRCLPARTRSESSRRRRTMKVLYCWRCCQDVPMLDELEFAEVAALYSGGMSANSAFRELHGIPLEHASIHE